MVIIKFFELSKICITTNTVKELFTNVGGKPKMVHTVLFELRGVKFAAMNIDYTNIWKKHLLSRDES